MIRPVAPRQGDGVEWVRLPFRPRVAGSTWPPICRTRRIPGPGVRQRATSDCSPGDMTYRDRWRRWIAFTYIDLSVTVSPVLDHQGQLTGVSLIARDVSDKRRSRTRIAGSEPGLGLAGHHGWVSPAWQIGGHRTSRWKASGGAARVPRATSSLPHDGRPFAQTLQRRLWLFGGRRLPACDLTDDSRNLPLLRTRNRRPLRRRGIRRYSRQTKLCPARAFQVAERIRQAVLDARILHSDFADRSRRRDEHRLCNVLRDTTRLVRFCCLLRGASRASTAAKNAGRNRVAVLDLDSARCSESTLSDQRGRRPASCDPSFSVDSPPGCAL